jgi:hypothetical protein
LRVFAGPAGLALGEGCSGAALLLCTRPLLQSLAREPVDRRVINVARILAMRQLLQGLATARRPTRRTLQVGAAVDALHAATMVMSATATVGPRRLTIANAAMAGGFAATGVAQSHRR